MTDRLRFRARRERETASGCFHFRQTNRRSRSYQLLYLFRRETALKTTRLSVFDC
jgi:hypothetical protein